MKNISIFQTANMLLYFNVLASTPSVSHPKYFTWECIHKKRNMLMSNHFPPCFLFIFCLPLSSSHYSILPNAWLFRAYISLS